MTRALVTPVRPDTEPEVQTDPRRPARPHDRSTAVLVVGDRDPTDPPEATAIATAELDSADLPPTDAELWFG